MEENSVKPIRPEEVTATTKQIPDVVIQAFNNLIAANFSGTRAVLDQDRVVAEIRMLSPQTRLQEVTRDEIFASGWLDVEPIYREAGWHVAYDKGMYGEGSRFIFTPRKAEA